MRIAILGGGNGGHAMAADLALRGHEVRMFETQRFADRLGPTLRERRIVIDGVGPKGEAVLRAVTTDPAEAVAGAELVVVVVPAFAQEVFFQAVMPHLESGQTVMVVAGDYGALRLRHLLSRQRPELRVKVGETNSLPYGARLKAPGHVWVFALPEKDKHLVAACPASETQEVLALWEELYPVSRGENVLAVALSNPNPTVHAAGSLLNTGRIQYSKGEFYLYREGITEAVARVIRAVYEEQAAVGRAYGCQIATYRDRDFRTRSSIMGACFWAPFDLDGLVGEIKGPSSVDNRYFTEDIPYGLVPASELAAKAQVRTPVIDALIDLGSVICQRDFRKEGRTLSQLGLEEMDPQEIVEYLSIGG